VLQRIHPVLLFTLALPIAAYLYCAEAYADTGKEDSRFYMGADLYQLNLDVGQNGFEKHIVPDEYDGVGITLGMRPSIDPKKKMGVGFDLWFLLNGHNASFRTCEGELCANGNGSWDFNMLGASALFYVPLSRSRGLLELIGSAGIGRASYELKGEVHYSNGTAQINSSDIGNEKESGIITPVGIAFQFTPHKKDWTVRLSYMRFTLKNSHDRRADKTSLGLLYTF